MRSTAILFTLIYATLMNAQGKLTHIPDFKSEFVFPRNITVWVPDSYQRNPQKHYAVIYAQDGQNLFEAKTSAYNEAWELDFTAQKLINERKLKDCIIVGIWNTPLRASEYAPQKPFSLLTEKDQNLFYKRFFGTGRPVSDQYLRFMVQELKPYIDKNFRTKADKEHTMVMGSSMGALISLYALCEYPDVFGGAACLSTHWILGFDGSYDAFTLAMIQYLDKHLPEPNHKLYFDFGTETLDQWYEPYQTKIDQFLDEKVYPKANRMSKKFPGAKHSETSWRKRAYVPLLFLLGKN